MLKVRKIIPSKVLRGCLLLFIISVSFASSPAVPGSCDTDREVNPRLLTLVNPRFTPQWSPDGKSIAFTFGYWAKGSTYLANADGSSVRLISSSSGDLREIDFWPDVSPDGSSIVYATTRHRWEEPPEGCLRRNFEIETSSLDGSDRRRLTNHGLWDVSPAWSPDGASIAFARFGGCYPVDRPGGDHGIFSTTPDGSETKMISGFAESFVAAGYQSGPVWSPDGGTLAFVSQVDATPGSVASRLFRDVLYAVGEDGTDLKRLFATDNHYVDAILGTPAWSPDGLNLAFVTYLANNYQERWKEVYFRRSREEWPKDTSSKYSGDVPPGLTLYVVSSDGLELSELAYLGEGPPFLKTTYYGLSNFGDNISDSYNVRLEWSNDGNEILLSNSQNIYLINTDGSGIRARIDGAYGSWSLDGTRIAITTVREISQDYTNGNPSVVLFTTNENGADRRILVRADGDGLIAESPVRKGWFPFFGLGD